MHYFILKHPTWFTAERFSFRPRFLRRFFIKLHFWALRRIEKNSREEIRALSLRRAKRVVKYAYKNIPFWREHLTAAGLNPENIKTFEDFSKIPPVNRELFQSIPREKLFWKGAGPSRFSWITTSGSTGRPIELAHDLWLEERDTALRLRRHFWLNPPPDTIFIRTQGTLGYPPDQFTILLKAHGSGVDSVSKVKNKIYELCDHRPCIISGHPSFLFLLAQEIKKERNTFRLYGLLSSGECLEPQTRAFLREVFQSKVQSIYGGVEAGGYVAQECEEGRHHIYLDQCLVEILDSRGKPVPAGTVGKIFITNLNNFLMPIIRFENGDLGSISEESCPCGRPFPILTFEGRNVALARLPSGKIIHAFDLLWPLAKRAEWISHYQVIRKSTQEFETQIVPRGSQLLGDIEELRAELSDILRDEAKMEIKIVSEIKAEKFEKFRAFRSLLAEDGELAIYQAYKPERN